MIKKIIAWTILTVIISSIVIGIILIPLWVQIGQHWNVSTDALYMSLMPEWVICLILFIAIIGWAWDAIQED